MSIHAARCPVGRRSRRVSTTRFTSPASAHVGRLLFVCWGDIYWAALTPFAWISKAVGRSWLHFLGRDCWVCSLSSKLSLLSTTLSGLCDRSTLWPCAPRPVPGGPVAVPLKALCRSTRQPTASENAALLSHKSPASGLSLPPRDCSARSYTRRQARVLEWKPQPVGLPGHAHLSTLVT